MVNSPETGDGNEPPGPGKKPVVGAAVDYIRRPFKMREEVVKEYGDVVDMSGGIIGGRDAYMVSHPDYIEKILVSRNDVFSKELLLGDTIEKFLGNGILVSDGEFWRNRRRVVQPPFHPENLSEYSETMRKKTREWIEDIERGETLEIDDEMHELTMNILVESLFGISDIDYERIGKAFDGVYSKINPTKGLVPEWIPIPANRRYARAINELEDVIDELVEERRVEEFKERTDLLSILVSEYEKENERDAGNVDRKGIRDEIMNFLLAGHETTALALTYTFYLLSKHPEEQEKVRSEVRELEPDVPRYGGIEELDYTENVITEAMRLYPPVHSITRKTDEDVELGGYKIREDSNVFMSQWVVHRDERWYDNPERFEPERWEKDRERPKFAYFPFGGGKRRCIGADFAYTEAKTVASALIRDYELTPVTEDPLDLSASITTRPKEKVEISVQRLSD